jgi:DNA-directed RNA polymerase specialized sigma24 family protein
MGQAMPRDVARAWPSSPWEAYGVNKSDQPASFPTTRWSLVAHAVNPAAPEARAALAELCAGYWYPIYAFIRRKGHEPDLALDLTQDYFTRLLETGVLASADRRLGRFRAFLRTDCGFFLSHNHERREAIKRGGGQRALAIDGRDAEGRYLREPTDAATPDRLFDRTWAVSLLDEVLKQLAREYADTGRAAQFKILEGAIGLQARQVSYGDLAARMGSSEGAIQQAVQRLRKRYKAILRARIAATLEDPDEAAIDDEIRDLFKAFAN